MSFWGPVIGALVFILARDLLGALTETWLLWYGLLFIVMVLFQPEGDRRRVADGTAAEVFRRASAPLHRNSPGRRPWLSLKHTT